MEENMFIIMVEYKPFSDAGDSFNLAHNTSKTTHTCQQQCIITIG